MRDSVLRPLEQLMVAVQRFCRRRELRLLWIESDDELRTGAAKVAAGIEHLADNSSPLLAFDVATDGASNRAWSDALSELRKAHARSRTSGAPLAELRLEATPKIPLGALAVALKAASRSVRAPGSGLVVLLGSSSTSVAGWWVDEFSSLLASRELDGVRFIVVAPLGSATQLESMRLDRASVLVETCVVDRQRAILELEDDIASEEREGAGRRGAWPLGVRPPPPHARGDDDTVTTDRQLRLHVKRSALAVARGQETTALREQAAARDLCLARGRARDAIRMELMLGAYLMKFEHGPLAERTFEEAAARATDQRDDHLVARAWRCVAAVREQRGNPRSALAAYGRSFEAAKRADDAPFAIRTAWDAGQLARRHGWRDAAGHVWSDAKDYTRARLQRRSKPSS